MLTEREELEQKLNEICLDLCAKNEITFSISREIYNKHNFSTKKTTDIISQKITLESLNDAVLFFLCEELIPDSIADFFTPKEIDVYSKMQFEMPYKINLPYTLKMTRVADDQWIGVSNAGFFIGMGLANYIQYNSDTQRIMTKIKSKNGMVIWKPTINEKAVKEIQDSYENGTFISNTITLNFTDSSKLDYSYDEKTGDFTIYSLDHFDITDGYHRFLAMNNCFTNDEDFNFPMEIRITNFDEAKAQHWIFQEDKKTKMKKIDSESLNQNSYPNQIVERLNSFGSCLQGKINRSDGIINFSELAHQIDKYYYGKEVAKETKESMGYKSKVVTELKGKFGLLNDLYPDFFEERIDKALIIVLIREFFLESDDKALESTIKRIVENKGAIINLLSCHKNKESKAFFDELDKLIKEAQDV